MPPVKIEWQRPKFVVRPNLLGLLYCCQKQRAVGCCVESHLELKLSRHHFSVRASDFDASVETGAVMSLQHVTTQHFVSSDTAVIWTYTTNRSVTLSPHNHPTFRLPSGTPGTITTKMHVWDIHPFLCKFLAKSVQEFRRKCVPNTQAGKQQT